MSGDPHALPSGEVSPCLQQGVFCREPRALGVRDTSLGDTLQLSAGRDHPILDPSTHWDTQSVHLAGATEPQGLPGNILTMSRTRIEKVCQENTTDLIPICSLCPQATCTPWCRTW